MAALGVAALLLAGCTADTPRNSAGQVTAAATADVFAVRVGDCLGDVGTGTVDELKLVPCSEEHSWEAYASSSIEAERYPGTTEVQAQAEDACDKAFTEFVGVDVRESRYTFTYLHPTAESWAQDDREVVCLAGKDRGAITGSLKGTGK